VQGFARGLSRRSTTGIRNRALLIVLWRTGLRISEALTLRPADVNPEAGTLDVLKLSPVYVRSMPRRL
jgi:site-specific recombinase XerD